MSKIFFGFDLADLMFNGNFTIVRKNIQPENVKKLADNGDLTPCLSPNHQATIKAARERFGITIKITEAPPRVALDAGDSVIIMEVRGIPRLTGRHEYSIEEIGAATLTFSEYTVI